MKIGYADTSCLVAVALGEPGSEETASALQECDLIVASNLLEAELRSALAREGVGIDPGPLLDPLTWVHPDRSLSDEYETILNAGYLRGADLWHLACALYLRRSVPALAFLSLDRQQNSLAAKVGFAPAPPVA